MTIVYSVAEIGPFLGVFVATRGLVITNQQLLSGYPDSAYSVNSAMATNLPVVFMALLPLILGWIISVVYLHGYVRRRVAAGSNGDKAAETG